MPHSCPFANIYTTSELYRSIQTDDPEETSKTIFNEKLTEKGYTLAEVHTFLKNYKTVPYTEDNIEHYVSLVEFFMYDVAGEFCKFIYKTYIKPHQRFLDKICQYSSVQRIIKDECKNGTYCEDCLPLYNENRTNSKILPANLPYIIYDIERLLTYLASYVDIEELWACVHVANAVLLNMNLTVLHLQDLNTNVTNSGIVHMTQLKSLHMSIGRKLNEEIFEHCKEIEKLTLQTYAPDYSYGGPSIRNRELYTALTKLPKLKKLVTAKSLWIGNVIPKENINNDELEKLDLEELTLYGNTEYMGRGLRNMPRLTVLNLSYCNVELEPLTHIPTLIDFCCVECDFKEKLAANTYLQQISPINLTPYPQDITKLDVDTTYKKKCRHPEDTSDYKYHCVLAELHKNQVNLVVKVEGRPGKHFKFAYLGPPICLTGN